jgi:hypothetical protein
VAGIVIDAVVTNGKVYCGRHAFHQSFGRLVPLWVDPNPDYRETLPTWADSRVGIAISRRWRWVEDTQRWKHDDDEEHDEEQRSRNRGLPPTSTGWANLKPDSRRVQLRPTELHVGQVRWLMAAYLPTVMECRKCRAPVRVKATATSAIG